MSIEMIDNQYNSPAAENRTSRYSCRKAIPTCSVMLLITVFTQFRIGKTKRVAVGQLNLSG